LKRSVTFLVLVFILPSVTLNAQPVLPTFLDGTWKIENSEIYEMWELISDRTMTGQSFRVREGEQVITEYLEIKQINEQIIYTATVLNQNDGAGIEFVLSQPDSQTWIFENPDHDFPKKILYQKRSSDVVYVEVSDGGDRGFAYTMHRVVDEKSNELLSFFKDITGTWIASPEDSSFISRLVYKMGEEQFLIIAGNTISSGTGELFAVYEGVYLFNPVDNVTSFTTLSDSEIHTGFCEVKGDTLFHKATVSGNNNVKSYTSAIVKNKSGTLYYYADYSQSDEIPDLRFNNPLIYRKN
jgi:hypothetical protein